MILDTSFGGVIFVLTNLFSGDYPTVYFVLSVI